MANGLIIPIIFDSQSYTAKAVKDAKAVLKNVSAAVSKADALKLPVKVNTKDIKNTTMQISQMFANPKVHVGELQSAIDILGNKLAKLAASGRLVKDGMFTAKAENELKTLTAIYDQLGSTQRVSKQSAAILRDFIEQIVSSATTTAAAETKKQTAIRNTTKTYQAMSAKVATLSQQLMETSMYSDKAGTKMSATWIKTANALKQAKMELLQYQINMQQAMSSDAQAAALKAQLLESVLAQVNTVNQLNATLGAYREAMNTATIGSPEFKDAAIKAAELSEKIAKVNYYITMLGQESTSINGLAAQISELNRLWNQLSIAQKNSSNTTVVDAQGNIKTLATMKAEMKALIKTQQEYGASLSELVSKELAEEKANMERQRVMSMTAKTLGDLNAKVSAYRQAMESTEVGTPAWNQLVLELKQAEAELAKVQSQMQMLGMEAGSIEKLNASIADLNRQWASMGAAQKFDASGKLKAQAATILNSYRQQAEALEKQGMSLADILNKEKQRAKKAEDVTNRLKKEQRILNSSRQSVTALQQKIQILTRLVNNSEVGSTAFDKWNTQLKIAQEQLAKIQPKIAGFSARQQTAAQRTKDLNTALGLQGGYIGSLIQRMIVYAGVSRLIRMIRDVREITAEFELQRVALGALLQDMDKAGYLFDKIKRAAVQSPFEIKDLVTYTKQLAAYQIEQEELFGTMNRLADLSAGLGVEMDRLILAYGQVKSASVLRGQEMRQFTEAGIPMVQALADKFTELRGTAVSTAEVFDLVSKRMVSFEMVKEVIEDMTGVTGQFYKMQEKQSKTLQGQWANLKDSLSIMYDEIGNTTKVHDAMENMIALVKKWATNWERTGKSLRNIIAMLAAVKIASLNAATAAKAYTLAEAAAAWQEHQRAVKLPRLTKFIIGNTAATRIETTATNMLRRSTIAATMSTNIFSKAWWNLTAAMAANPIGVIIAGFSVLVGLIASLVRKTTQQVDEMQTLYEVASQIADMAQEYSDFKVETSDLLTAYEQLSNKMASGAELSSKEQKKLSVVTQELAKRFLGTGVSLDEETGKYIVNTEAIRENIKARSESMEQNINSKKEYELQQLAEEEARLEEINKQIAIYNQRGGVEKVATFVSPSTGATTTATYIKEDAKYIRDLEAQAAELTASIGKTKAALAEAEYNMNRTVGRAAEDLAGWRQYVYSTFLRDGNPLFTRDELKNFENEKEFIEEVGKQWKDYGDQRAKLEAAIAVAHDENLKASLKADLDYVVKEEKLRKDIIDAFGGIGILDQEHHAHTKDPWITIMEDRIKFMKDFKSGVDSLKKYNNEFEAIVTQQENMAGRAASLGLDADEIQGSAQELSQWYTEAIDTVVAKLQKMGGAFKNTGDITKLLGISSKNEAVKDLQSLLQRLWDEKTDLDLSTKESELKRALKDLSDRVAASKEANDFFEDMLGLTGNLDLSSRLAESIYGTNGANLKQATEEHIRAAFKDIDISDAIDGNGNINYAVLSDKLSLFGENNSDYKAEAQRVVEEGIRANANWLKDLVQTYEKAKTYEERMDTIRNQAERKRAEIQASTLSDSEKQQYTDAVSRKEAEDIAAVKVEQLKESEDWIKTFEDVGKVSGASIQFLIDQLEELIALEGKNMAPESLRTLVDNLEKLQAEKINRNPYEGITEGLQEYALAVRRVTKLEKEGKKGSAEWRHAKDDQRKAAKKVTDSVEQMQDAYNQLGQVVGAAQDLISGLGVKADSDTAVAFEGVAQAITLIGTAIAFVSAMCTMLVTSNPWILAAAAILSALVSIFTVVSNLKVNKANREIEKQQDVLDNLEEAYDRLEKAQARAFGTDYIENYRKELEILQAEQEAYRKQAEAESEKGKKTDEKKIKDYEKSAREAQEKMMDMQTQLSEHFTGSTLADAARDFASAWIDAYKEFASTTDAMKGKFSDMIETMVTESIAARVMQTFLKPIFDQIDEYAKDGDLSADDISAIATLASNSIGAINDGMTLLMNQLASAGYNVRSSVSGLTGISKDIASASEESILGLAAGINTQNFYISAIRTDVAQILAMMQTGGASLATAATASADGMTTMDYLAYIPTIAGHTASMVEQCEAILTQCESIAANIGRVVKPAGTSSGYRVITN